MEMKTSTMPEVVTPDLGYAARDTTLNPQSTYIEIIERPSAVTLSRLKEISSVVFGFRWPHRSNTWTVISPTQTH
jgi:hypothetical protein